MANITLKKKTASNTTETIYPKTKWTQVLEKPSSFNPAPHSHLSTDITNIPTNILRQVSFTNGILVIEVV